MTEFLKASGLVKHFNIRSSFLDRGKPLIAVDNITFVLDKGETLGVVGESGCGKSTMARLVLGMLAPTKGQVSLAGEEVHSRRDRMWRAQRRRMQMVYQNPLGSLDRRMSVGTQVAEPLIIHRQGLTGRDRRDLALETLSLVGLGPENFDSYPHELSGGQRQRVVLARALILSPELLVCDEPISALDVSVAAQVLNLMKEIQSAKNLTYLFISHDLKAVRQIADRIIVMYLGRIVEEAGRDELFRSPRHPYTKALISAIPRANQTPGKATILAGDPPNPMDIPRGCAFHPRCPCAVEKCRRERPPLRSSGSGRKVSCHLEIQSFGRTS
ncbi:oligopeptide/dipeptide ABC transporter ATP-binding protein [Rhizobium sp. ZPR3]|uniref:Oligopeptide/dipeptide ABC transporter ATP-binding protein n=2 Tax=unclassified Rhizobium TaxID=2613769 RepID=A0AAU7SRE6_9HYPH